mmetsp:Transcript_53244/g.154982  ORF Transcript_53244/g.154982 Transcript_53244/m.154982 type:complete len:245 (-) Transcript_53244:571-1305(-)
MFHELRRSKVIPESSSNAWWSANIRSNASARASSGSGASDNTSEARSGYEEKKPLMSVRSSSPRSGMSSLSPTAFAPPLLFWFKAANFRTTLVRRPVSFLNCSVGSGSPSSPLSQEESSSSCFTLLAMSVTDLKIIAAVCRIFTNNFSSGMRTMADTLCDNIMEKPTINTMMVTRRQRLITASIWFGYSKLKSQSKLVLSILTMFELRAGVPRLLFHGNCASTTDDKLASPRATTPIGKYDRLV